MTFFITGASRGIGLELTIQALSLGHSVVAGVRDPNKTSALKQLQLRFSDKLQIIKVDTSIDESVASAADSLDTTFDVLINNAGVYLDARAGNLRELNSQLIMDTLQTNTIGPLRVTRAFLPQLLKSKSGKVINITSLMGSIADNAGGGSYAYRMSKTALNMFSKCLSIEYPQLTVVSIHPGWVKTDMGGKGANVSIPDSAKGILSLALNSTAKDSGKFFDYRGKELPW